RLHALDQVGERRPPPRLRQRLLEGADQLGGLRQEVVERAGEVGEEIDQELERLLREFGEVRIVEVERRKVGEVLRGAVERAQHLGGRHAAGQGGRQEGAGRESDVDVEVGGLAVDEEVVERLQAAELVGAAADRAPCQHRRTERKSTRLNSSHQIISYAV